jgi:hypothetical protein
MTEYEKQQAILFKDCFGTDTGKRVLDNLSGYCFENRSTFVEGSHDKQNVNQGKRSVILYIREILNRNLDEKVVEFKNENNYI